MFFEIAEKKDLVILAVELTKQVPDPSKAKEQHDLGANKTGKKITNYEKMYKSKTLVT